MLRSRDAPDKATILAAKAFFEGIEYPAVMHCKSGADRAGLAAALYLILHEGRPVAEAARQLSARYGHFRFAKTGILDAFFDRYLAEGEPRASTSSPGSRPSTIRRPSSAISGRASGPTWSWTG